MKTVRRLAALCWLLSAACEQRAHESTKATSTPRNTNSVPAGAETPSPRPNWALPDDALSTETRASNATTGPVYLRLRNDSNVSFDTLDVARLPFGALRAHAQSPYRLFADSLYANAGMRARSGKAQFGSTPIDNSGEHPLAPGYYTGVLTIDPKQDLISNLTMRVSRDSPPN